jgi:hypothetical protein
MGAICRMCGEDMDTSATCKELRVETVDGPMAPIPYGSEAEDWGAASGARCHDCLVHPGGFHHPGCDVESCPRCGGQLLTCDCIVSA